jgi:hypothetical protein
MILSLLSMGLIIAGLEDREEKNFRNRLDRYRINNLCLTNIGQQLFELLSAFSIANSASIQYDILQRNLLG